MKLIAKHNNKSYTIEPDLTQVGFYLYTYDNDGKRIATNLQVTQQLVKNIAFEEYSIPIIAWKENIDTMCCFCGESVDFDNAINLSILTDKDLNEFQTIYSHKHCLEKVLHKSVLENLLLPDDE